VTVAASPDCGTMAGGRGQGKEKPPGGGFSGAYCDAPFGAATSAPTRLGQALWLQR